MIYDIQLTGVCWKYGKTDRQAHGVSRDINKVRLVFWFRIDSWMFYDNMDI